jgi:hypothetical protein
MNVWDFSDIDDSDVSGFLKWNIDACKKSTEEELIILRNIFNENQIPEGIDEISIEKHNQNIKDLEESSISNLESERYTENNWVVTHEVLAWETLGEIVGEIYWFTKRSEIKQQIIRVKAYNYEKWITLTDTIDKWQKINFPIDDIEIVSKRLAEVDEQNRLKKALENQKELEKLENQRTDKQSEEENSFFKAEILDTWPKLSLAPFSGELSPDALEVYKGMKSTKWSQVIGQYRNKDGEVEDIILCDNKWKNIYMELDGSYTWDDIDGGIIDNIWSEEELEKVMVKLLKTYEKENREDY